MRENLKGVITHPNFISNTGEENFKQSTEPSEESLHYYRKKRRWGAIKVIRGKTSLVLDRVW